MDFYNLDDKARPYNAWSQWLIVCDVSWLMLFIEILYSHYYCCSRREEHFVAWYHSDSHVVVICGECSIGLLFYFALSRCQLPSCGVIINLKLNSTHIKGIVESLPLGHFCSDGATLPGRIEEKLILLFPAPKTVGEHIGEAVTYQNNSCWSKLIKPYLNTNGSYLLMAVAQSTIEWSFFFLLLCKTLWWWLGLSSQHLCTLRISH